MLALLIAVLFSAPQDPSILTVPAQIREVKVTEEVPPETIQQIATKVAESNKLNVEHFLSVIECESSFNPNAVGDSWRSFGIAQIFLPAHPEITKKEALDPEWALHWMANEWVHDRYRQWSCYNNLY